MKILMVGDLHLHDKELSTTKGMRENNLVMLQKIYDYLVENEDIKLCIFEGDIQHKTPASKSALYETSRWRFLLRKIGNLMTSRAPKMVTIQREGFDKDRAHPMPAKLYSLEGNHDMATELRSMNQHIDYTFFDDLVYEGIIQNPLGLAFKDSGKMYYIQLNNYGEANAPLPKEVRDKNNFTIVKMFHDTIDVPEQGDWVRIDKTGKGTYKGSEVLDNCHLGISGHIHDPLEPTLVETVSGNKVPFVQTGSMGRTSASDVHMRDVGYCTVLDTTDGLNVIQVQMNLVPVDDYYDWSKIMLNNHQKDSLKNSKNFNISLGDYERKHYEPRDDIKEMDIPEDVKKNCLNVLDNIEK